MHPTYIRIEKKQGIKVHSDTVYGTLVSHLLQWQIASLFNTSQSTPFLSQYNNPIVMCACCLYYLHCNWDLSVHSTEQWEMQWFQCHGNNKTPRYTNILMVSKVYNTLWC